jgi:hypothetical protein
MLGLKTFGWIDQRLREVFPERRDDFFGGLSVILIGDFFQLPPSSTSRCTRQLTT